MRTLTWFCQRRPSLHLTWSEQDIFLHQAGKFNLGLSQCRREDSVLTLSHVHEAVQQCVMNLLSKLWQRTSHKLCAVHHWFSWYPVPIPSKFIPLLSSRSRGQVISGPIFPTMTTISLKFTQPLDRSKLLTKLKALRDQQSTQCPFSGNVYSVRGRTKFTGNELLTSLGIRSSSYTCWQGIHQNFKTASANCSLQYFNMQMEKTK